MIERDVLLALMGIPADELVSDEEAEGGTLATTRDGVRYLYLPPDVHDAEGKSGLMYAAEPWDGYADSFPVFKGAPAPLEPTEEPQDPLKGPEEAAEPSHVVAGADASEGTTASAEPVATSSEALGSPAAPETPAAEATAAPAETSA